MGDNNLIGVEIGHTEKEIKEAMKHFEQFLDLLGKSALENMVKYFQKTHPETDPDYIRSVTTVALQSLRLRVSTGIVHVSALLVENVLLGNEAVLEEFDAVLQEFAKKKLIPAVKAHKEVNEAVKRSDAIYVAHEGNGTVN